MFFFSGKSSAVSSWGLPMAVGAIFIDGVGLGRILRLDELGVVGWFWTLRTRFSLWTCRFDRCQMRCEMRDLARPHFFVFLRFL